MVRDMQKTCFCCQRTLDISSFHQHKGMKDGHLNKCISCRNAEERLRYADNRVRISEYEQKRRQTPERKRQQADAQRRRRQRASYKDAARQKVRRAVESGKLLPMPCEICGLTTNIQGHHEDYSEPLKVRWLCFTHHRAVHGQVVTVVNPNIGYTVPVVVDSEQNVGNLLR